MDYNDPVNEKKLQREFLTPNPENIYLLKAKERYIILFPAQKNGNQIKLVQSGEIPVK